MNALSLYVIAFLVVLETCGPVFGVELPRICPVLSVSEAPALDGKIDDAAWRDAYPMVGFVVLGQPRSAAVKQTTFRAVHTTNALYVAVECREPDMGKLQTATQDFWKVDSVEIFIQPKEGGPYWQMVVSSDGGREEYRGFEKFTDMSSWEAKVYRGADFYGMEVKLPFDIFGKRPVSGEGWRFNIARNTTTPNADLYSTWSPLMRGFHEPENFGKVVFFGAVIDKATISREVFNQHYKAVDVWITAYKDMYRKYDKDFLDCIAKFLVETGWEELRQKVAKIDGLSPENVELAEQELEKIVKGLSKLDMMRQDMLKKRIFNP